MEYTVVIRKHNCKNADYHSPYNCPLARAIREQLPLLEFILVSSHYVFILNGGKWKFKDFLTEGWGEKIMEKIKSGKIKEYSVTLTSLNHLEELSEVNLKEASKLVNESIVLDKVI